MPANPDDKFIYLVAKTYNLVPSDTAMSEPHWRDDGIHYITYGDFVCPTNIIISIDITKT
jgi:hypothetical protein